MWKALNSYRLPKTNKKKKTLKNDEIYNLIQEEFYDVGQFFQSSKESKTQLSQDSRMLEIKRVE